MSEYPEEFPWFDVLIMCAHLLAAVIALMSFVYWFTRITPEREAELRAEGAAEADRKADAVGGWSKWIAREIGVDARCSCVVIVNGQDARCPSVASADVSTGEAASRSEVARVVQDARRPSREVR